MKEAAPRRVGLLVVHGIGEQTAGETSRDVVAGLQRAYGAGSFIQEGTVWVKNPQISPDDPAVVIPIGSREPLIWSFAHFHI